MFCYGSSARGHFEATTCPACHALPCQACLPALSAYADHPGPCKASCAPACSSRVRPERPIDDPGTTVDCHCIFGCFITPCQISNFVQEVCFCSQLATYSSLPFLFLNCYNNPFHLEPSRLDTRTYRIPPVDPRQGDWIAASCDTQPWRACPLQIGSKRDSSFAGTFFSNYFCELQVLHHSHEPEPTDEPTARALEPYCVLATASRRRPSCQ